MTSETPNPSTAVQAGRETTPHQQLLYYMRGWMKGAGSSAFTREQMEQPDFKQGYEDGRTARKAAYATASERIGAVLSPLRLWSPVPEGNQPSPASSEQGK